MHKLIKEQLKDFQSGFNGFSKRKKATSNKKTSFRLPRKHQATSPITTAKKVGAVASKSKKLSPRRNATISKDPCKNKKDSGVVSPLNETTISSLDLTAITPQTPRKETNKGNKNYKNGSCHCGRRGGGGCSGSGEGDRSGDIDYLQKLRETASAATSPIRLVCGSSALNGSLKLEPQERVESGRKLFDCRFKKKEKISDFVNFIELLSEYC